MKKLMTLVLAALGFAVANAGDVPTIRKGHFLEDIKAFADEHPATSQRASGGDIIYATDDYEYHIFTNAGTLTFGAAVEDAQILLVGGGGGAGWNGGGGGGGGAFVELSNQSIDAGSYTVAVGTGGAAAYADSKAWGQTGGTSSISGITGASAPGGTGGVGWNGANATPKGTGGEAGKAGNAAGGNGGKAGGSGDNPGSNGSAGSKSEILGVEQGFAGGGGGGGHVDTQKAHAPSYGQDGGGNGAGSEGSITLKYLATSGEDGLGGGGGGGASGTWASQWPSDGTTENKSRLLNSGDGGDGIVIVRLVVIHDDRIVPPEGKQLTYTGTLQRGVEEGEGYTLMGTVEATDVGSYTATATLDEGETWNDDTTDPKTIEWSITKAENSWLDEPALSKTSWPENKAPATLTKGAAKFGTMTATLNGEAFDLDNPEFPTVRGEYTLVITVAGSDNWNGLEKQLAFTITEAVQSVKHYMVGKDADEFSSFVKSSTSAIGWAISQDGAVDANHEVKEDDTYVVPSGTTLRTLYDNDDVEANTFKGDSLTVAGELNLRAATGTGRRKITINNLIADGGTINAASTQNHQLELAGSISIPAGKNLKINLKSNEDNNTHFNDLRISATVTGSGAIDPLLFATANKSTRAKLDLSGDWSGFTGDIESTQTASGGSKGFTFMITGQFGGRFSVMPQTDQDPNYVVNYGGLVDGKKFGLRFKDGFPNRTRYRTVFYNVDPEKKNLALVTCGRSVDPISDKGLTGLYYEKTDSADTALTALLGGAATKFDQSKMTAVNNGNDTQTVFYNYVGFETPTFSGTITMDDWTEGETPSEPSGLTVTPPAAQGSLSYKYYSDSECTQSIAKPTLAGTYYVRGEVAEGDDGNETFWKSAVSEPKEFTINQQAGGKTRVEIPVGKKLSYTGNEQVGVDAGEHYTLSQTFKATAVGNYEAVATLENTDDYEWTDLTTEPKTIAWSIKKAENTWTRRASITKKFWKSTEEPGVITPPEAAFGEPKAQISKNGGAFEDWDDEMPTEKGRYEVRWAVADTDSYSALEDSVKFLIDYRYEPTAPFMVSTDNGETWTGKATLVDACQNSGIVEVCENIDVLEFPTLTANVTLRSNTDDEGIRYTITGTTSKSSFTVYNGGKLTLSNVAFNLLPSANIPKFASLGTGSNNMEGSIEIKENVEFSGKVTGGFIQNANGNDGTLHTHITISGGTIKDLTAGSSLISAPGDASFSVKNLTIENCTCSNGALIAAGNKTLNLSNVTITNNTTTAGAITVGTEGVLKVSGDVIVKDNKVGDDAKNIVLQNAANLQMVDALGANASVGVSFGEQLGDVFGSFTKAEATKDDMKTASAFKNDADAALSGKVNRDNKLIWWKAPGLLLIIN